MSPGLGRASLAVASNQLSDHSPFQGVSGSLPVLPDPDSIGEGAILALALDRPISLSFDHLSFLMAKLSTSRFHNTALGALPVPTSP